MHPGDYQKQVRSSLRPALFTVNDTCNYIGASRSGVYRLLAEGKLKALKQGQQDPDHGRIN